MPTCSYTLAEKAACEARVCKILDAYFDEPVLLRTHPNGQYYLVANLQIFPFGIEEDFHVVHYIHGVKGNGVKVIEKRIHCFLGTIDGINDKATFSSHYKFDERLKGFHSQKAPLLQGQARKVGVYQLTIDSVKNAQKGLNLRTEVSIRFAQGFFIAGFLECLITGSVDFFCLPILFPYPITVDPDRAVLRYRRLSEDPS